MSKNTPDAPHRFGDLAEAAKADQSEAFTRLRASPDGLTWPEARRRMEELGPNELASQNNSPGTIVFRQCNVGKSADCRAAVEDAVARWGGLDIICNNAGIQPKNSYLPVHELIEEMWDAILDVNLKSTYID